MFMASSSEVSGEVPGLQSVASAIGTPCRRNSSTGGCLRLAEEVEGAGQQHRHRAGRRHRRGAVLVGVFEMIGRERAVARGQRGAVQVRELVGVQLHRQAQRACAASNTRAVCSGEKAMPSQNASTASARPSRGDGRQHLVADQVDDSRPCRRRPPAAARARRGRSCATVTGALGAEPARGAQLLAARSSRSSP